MRNKETKRPKTRQSSRSQPYHSFVDQRHPDNYRQEEIEALKRAIRAKENRLVLGMPDMGLSNLLRFLVTRADWGERNVTFAYLNCDALGGCLESELFFAEIARQFCEQGWGNKLGEDAQGYERLKRVVMQAGGDPLDRLVVVVDKTERMLAVVDNTFYRKLKALTDLNKRVCYIFATSPGLESIVDPEGLLFAGRSLKVGRFNERDFAGAVTEEGQRLEVEFNPADRQQLMYLTGGHPGLLRAVSSAVIGEKLDLSGLEIVLVERLLARADVKSRCQRVWQALNSTQQVALYAVASGQLDSVAEDILVWLPEFGFIDEDEGAYQLFSPIFQRFVTAQNIPLEPMMEETPLECITIVNPITIFKNGQDIVQAGKVLKGNQAVDVSPNELRLIACLKRERRMYQKAEIAKYVFYEDYEKGEGGPDPRIDSLVSQVRRRLGNQQYIKNHKKRGYEFVDGCYPNRSHSSAAEMKA